MSDSEIYLDFSPMFLIYKDGSINRKATERVPPSLDPEDNVWSKDVVYSPELNLSLRLYLPKHTVTNPDHKLNVLVYFHGGAFCAGSPFSAFYHNYLNTLVQAANVLLVSVEYRLAPEHRLPAAYNDGWTAVNWVASHANGNGPEEWLNSNADFDKVFFAGDSAGGNIAYNMAMRYSHEKLVGINLKGIALIHTYFWGKDPIGSESCKDMKMKERMDNLWPFLFPARSGLDDPFINPTADPNLATLNCSKVLIFVAEKDRYMLTDRGWLYYEALRKSGWGGNVEIMESKGEDHCFHLLRFGSEKSKAMLEKLVSFLNDQRENGDYRV
ncbi:hypothetical protein K2173_001127 [Erythroxylum novogranatense]|uniref:Alpha/beta hydrolase fold-3 domain-containing protein n=1 Tax=Erythroxylum novogranatense TaxID=1862640 RepID=A0AAV8TID5_9ROSI|nr:hypothetical protein K2173_001127 [Erythroxylum novogranatense]